MFANACVWVGKGGGNAGLRFPRSSASGRYFQAKVVGAALRVGRWRRCLAVCRIEGNFTAATGVASNVINLNTGKNAQGQKTLIYPHWRHYGEVGKKKKKKRVPWKVVAYRVAWFGGRKRCAQVFQQLEYLSLPNFVARALTPLSCCVVRIGSKPTRTRWQLQLLDGKKTTQMTESGIIVSSSRFWRY